ncbi:MAG TPA: hypothetical protein VI011_06620 [Asanoa sp.]
MSSVRLRIIPPGALTSLEKELLAAVYQCTVVSSLRVPLCPAAEVTAASDPDPVGASS